MYSRRTRSWRWREEEGGEGVSEEESADGAGAGEGAGAGGGRARLGERRVCEALPSVGALSPHRPRADGVLAEVEAAEGGEADELGQRGQPVAREVEEEEARHVRELDALDRIARETQLGQRLVVREGGADVVQRVVAEVELAHARRRQREEPPERAHAEERVVEVEARAGGELGERAQRLAAEDRRPPQHRQQRLGVEDRDLVLRRLERVVQLPPRLRRRRPRPAVEEEAHLALGAQLVEALVERSVVARELHHVPFDAHLEQCRAARRPQRRLRRAAARAGARAQVQHLGPRREHEAARQDDRHHLEHHVVLVERAIGAVLVVRTRDELGDVRDHRAGVGDVHFSPGRAQPAALPA